MIAQRLSKLGTFKKTGAPERQPAEVLIKRRKRGRNGDVSWEVVRARGHLDEVLEMRKGGSKLGELAVLPERPYQAQLSDCTFQREAGVLHSLLVVRFTLHRLHWETTVLCRCLSCPVCQCIAPRMPQDCWVTPSHVGAGLQYWWSA